MAVVAEHEIAHLRQYTKTSLLHHIWAVHNFDPPAHQKNIWIPALEDMSIKRLILVAPPKYGKSPCVGLDYLGWRIGNNPSYHGIYVSNTATQAYKPSVALRDTIAGNSMYRWFYDVHPNPSKGWAEHEWFVERPNEGDKDPTLQACGIGGPLLGATVEEVILDDVADPENMATAYQRDKLMSWLRNVAFSRLIPGGRVVMICTRWNEDDPAARFEKEGWKVFTIAAVDCEDAWCHDDVAQRWKLTPAGRAGLTYPEYWTPEALEERRLDLGTKDFMLMFQNQTLPEGGNIFKHEWWQYYDHLPAASMIIQKWDSVEESAVLTLRHNGFTKMMTFSDFWGEIDSEIAKRDGREIKLVNGWQIWGRRKFTDVKYISRHLFDGILKDVRNRCGRTLITANHSLLDCQGRRICPDSLKFRTNLPAPPWRMKSVKRNKYSLFVGSTEFAWACGLFVAEGSCYIIRRQKEHYADETATSISNKNVELLKRAQEAIWAETHILMSLYGPEKNGMLKLQSYNKLLFDYFHRFYDCRREKIVSDDLFNALPQIRLAFLAGYMAGDGYERGGMKSITTRSPILANQLVWMFNEDEGRRPRFYWRKDKPHIWHVQLGNHKLDTLSNAIRDVEYRGWIYDLETESHEFRAGNILVANTAFKTGQENDYSAQETWAVCDDGYYLIDAWRGKVNFPGLKGMLMQCYEQHHPIAVLVEDAASGQSLIDEARSKTGIPIIAVKVEKDKTSRATAITPIIEAGRVKLPRQAYWLQDWLYEHEVFPNGAHDDWVDCTSGALNWLRTHEPTGMAQPREVTKHSRWKDY